MEKKFTSEAAAEASIIFKLSDELAAKYAGAPTAPPKCYIVNSDGTRRFIGEGALDEIPYIQELKKTYNVVTAKEVTEINAKDVKEDKVVADKITQDCSNNSKDDKKHDSESKQNMTLRRFYLFDDVSKFI